MTDHPARLRELAARVARLGLNGRFDPEQVFAEREDVARSLRSLAKILEHAPAPIEHRSVATHHDRCRRLEALVAMKSAEARKLARLLATAQRPRRQPRHNPAGQLHLPFPGDHHHATFR